MVPNLAYRTTIRIGGVGIRLHTADASFCQTLENHYAGFAGPDPGAIAELEVELLPDSTPLSDEDIEVTREGALWRIVRGDFRAEWDPASRMGRVRQTANPYSIDTVLRIIHSLELAETGGFLLHAASAIRNQRAFVFTGVSGAGKTTISRLAPSDVTLLTDEISYIRREGDKYFAYGTPFAGELARVGAAVSAPIAGVHLLVQGPENHRDPIDDPATAVRKIMRNVLFFAQDPTLVNKVFETVCDFVERTNMYRLTFLPEQRVWDLFS